MHFIHFLCYPLFPFLFLLASPISSNAATILNSLPGYSGNLPSKFETGYIGVGEEEQLQLFYVFVESEGDPERDPLILWHTGGPGCSTLFGLLLDIGPLNFNYSDVNWRTEIPKLELNPYSWTKVSSIIFVDWPAGTGYSYSKTPEGYNTNDTTASQHNYEFLRKWFMDHAKFQKNPVYIAGDSYGGMVVPIIVNQILNGNIEGMEPVINVKGYILGNPATMQVNAPSLKYNFAHRVSLLSDELYESAAVNCNDSYVNIDARKAKCERDLQTISKNLENLYVEHVLEAKCNVSSVPTPCWEGKYSYLYFWANSKQVQQALHVHEIPKSWIRCNRSLPYARSSRGSVAYHQSLTKESLHVLIYSGDQDLMVPYLVTNEWIKTLNVLITDDWRPWFVNGQVAGYTTTYSNGHYHLTHATVKGAGHVAPQYKPRECFHMLIKWLRVLPL